MNVPFVSKRHLYSDGELNIYSDGRGWAISHRAASQQHVHLEFWMLQGQATTFAFGQTTDE